MKSTLIFASAMATGMTSLGTGFEPLDNHRARTKDDEAGEVEPPEQPKELTRQQRRYKARKGYRGW